MPVRPGAVLDAASLRAHVERHVTSGEISKYAIPAGFVAVDGLAKTSVGKLDKKRIRPST